MTDPVIEIPEAYKRADALIRELTQDKELGSKVRAKAKERYPDLQFPEDRIDPIVADVHAQLGEERAKREALEAAIKEKDDKADEARRAGEFSSQLETARSKYRLTEAGFEMALQRMRETSSYDADAAAAWAAMQNPAVKDPKAYLGPQQANFFGTADVDETYRELHKNPDRFVDKQLNEFFSDPEGFTRDAGFAI